jgi:hypothetical protein
MKFISSAPIAALALFAAGMTAQAQTSIEGETSSLEDARAPAKPFKPIYRVAGVYDSGGGGGQGVATAITCSSFSNEAEKIKLVIRRDTGTVAFAINTLTIAPMGSASLLTHAMAMPFGAPLNTGAMWGSATISATSTGMTCTAMTVGGSPSAPGGGAALHMTRLSPIKGTEE